MGEPNLGMPSIQLINLTKAYRPSPLTEGAPRGEHEPSLGW